ncbi:Threonine/homoserine/homoserine lactone efflux protein [Chelatococcus asaccharovorans]|uniref:Threonine/homoserine/homoserine lactone efflux protein n=1 Tax=Chelatococcus asaccharovorans TaxID=28210 RepID=A0A2V3U8B3_9HYPH|nr:LysE family translocator [Chelatococcus asaccharovorans]PXW58950.1 threonine/homoserine/homoserine lactone efflux protein [Chelatococcus asaccharovorans]CAH1658900.1 Threonine/homoserine/homoserine lactone efflux protein [Chelatococcus asaccharovorans]CAH1684361.1 Threonine/homoserine/homoserine lactone efflux protein [Chelatococcus asaccharovorans]
MMDAAWLTDIGLDAMPWISLEAWLAFAAASAVMLIIPGPTILLVVSYALGQGRQAAIPLVLGVTLGDITALVCSLAGLGAILATSALVFTLVKWLGAAYLIYLGIKLWRADASLAHVASPTKARPMAMFSHAALVTALNPKGIIFFVAFLPQFMDQGRPLLPQMIILAVTFIVLAFFNAAGYAILASSARRLVTRPRVLKAANRTGGSLLVCAGIATVSWRP